MKRLLFLLLWPLFAHAAPPIGYTQCAAENASCTLQSSGYVTYGADTHYSPAKHFAAGSVACNNTTFAPDPDVNVVKACYFVPDANVWSLLQGTTLISMSADATTCRSAAKAQVVKVTTTFTCQNTTVTNANPTVDTKTTDTLFSVITLAIASNDMSAMGPVIDKTKIPAPTAAASAGQYGFKPLNVGEFILPVPCNDYTHYPCTKSPISQAYLPIAANEGAFRIACTYSHMSFDDPIVFPGQPGISHLHTFVGKSDIGKDAYATTANILTKGVGTTCQGGEVNQSKYWFPAMIDTKDGTPIAPTSVSVYYKTSDAIPNTDIVPVPTGLRMITGNAKNTVGNADHTRYICNGVNGENPGWKLTLGDAALDSTCSQVGADLDMEIQFPICWDGVNLDSPNHNSHISDTEQYKVMNADGIHATYPSRCPADHPKHIPNITYNVHYTVTDSSAVKRYRLSSDAYDALQPAGRSGHADYMMGWKPEAMQTFITNCLLKMLDCHTSLLGDGTYLGQPN